MQLQKLAEAINQTHGKITIGLRTTMEEGIKIGQWLQEAKSKLRHGQWEKWADENLKMKPRMRRYYLQMAENPEKAVKCKTILDLARTVSNLKKEGRKKDRLEKIEEAVKNLQSIEDAHQILHSDNRQFPFPDFDHCFADPPWLCEGRIRAGQGNANAIEHYKWLADMCLEKLKPGGFLSVQCGVKDVFKVMPLFCKFNPVWILNMVFQQSAAVNYAFVTNWRPLLLFSKGTPRIPTIPVTDCITINGGEPKEWHDWQQPLKPYLRWIEALTQPGELVCSPFVGGGTEAVACKLLGRQFIGTDIEPNKSVAMARKRLAECTNEDSADWKTFCEMFPDGMKK